jgi:hypothetical protein
MQRFALQVTASLISAVCVTAISGRRAVAAASFSPEQIALYIKCEKCPPASQIQRCSEAIRLEPKAAVKSCS